MRRHTAPATAIRYLLLIYLMTVIYNLLLGVYLWFPEYDWWRIALPVPEAVLLGGILLLPAFRPVRLRDRLLLAGLAIAAVLLLSFSVGEAMFRHVYRRPFLVAPNLPLAVHFFNMLFDTQLFSRRLYLLGPAAVGAVLLAFCWFALLRGGVVLLRRGSPGLAAASLAVLATASLAAASGAPLTLRFFSQLEGERGPAISASYLTARPSAATEVPGGYAFPGIEDADVHLFVVESYGMTVFTNPHHRRRLAAFYRRLGGELERSGFAALSHSYASTAFGGTSWLADAALITGLDIDTQAKYDRVIDEDTRNLLHILRERGYRRILAAPGTSFMDERYRRFYDFSTYLMYEDFGYEGPYFTYGRMPDQYQLARAAEYLARQPSRQPAEQTERKRTAGQAAPDGAADEAPPRFVQYMLCSSHVPWNYIPPYRSSWDFPRAGRCYFDRSLNTYYENSWAVGSELFSGYTHSIRYSLQSVFGYIRRFLDEGAIAIVIGDHQPKFPVSEKGASFAVPVHVISANPELLKPWKRFGFVEGLEPQTGQEVPGMERFLGHFLTVAEGRRVHPRPRGAPEGTPR
jgi:hypothetical protein